MALDAPTARRSAHDREIEPARPISPPNVSRARVRFERANRMPPRCHRGGETRRAAHRPRIACTRAPLPSVPAEGDVRISRLDCAVPWPTIEARAGDDGEAEDRPAPQD